MLRRIIVALCFCLAWSAGPRDSHATASTIVQSAHGSLSATSTATNTGTCVFGSNLAASNTVVLAIVDRDASGGVQAYTSYGFAISDTISATYTKRLGVAQWISNVSRNGIIGYYTAPSGSGGADTITVTVSSGVSFKGGALFCFELHTLASPLTVDSTNSGNVNGTWGSGASFHNWYSSGGVSWTSQTPFIVTVGDSMDGAAASISASNAGYSTMTENTTNDNFYAIFAIGSSGNGFTSPDLVNVEDGQSGTAGGLVFASLALVGPVIPGGGGLMLLGCCN